MRPLLLRFAGLHSYRDEQVVDFTRLIGPWETGAGGIFGVFGPTGSGKSTILDAITLALYGKVERAPGGTMGCMHEAEQRLTVSFTFALGRGRKLRQYRVERRYTRADRHSLRTAACRLVRIDGKSEQVIADKEREVTAQVQEILGLGMEDFTRAVILPQGKFAEFLLLKGTDRRRMLERIFGLEQVGERLAERLRVRLSRVLQRLENINAEQQGHGDASAETLAAATQAHAAASAALEQAKAHLGQAEAAHAEGARVWELQAEWAQVAAEREAWAGQAARIVKAQTELEAARRADSIKRDLVEAEQAQAAEASSAASLAHARERLVAAQNQEAKAEAALRQAQVERAEHEPALLANKQRLEQAVALAGEVERATRQLQAEAEALAQAKADRRAHEEAMQRDEERRKLLMARRESVSQAVAAARVSPEWRAQIQRAQVALSAYETARQAFERRAQLRNTKKEAVRTQALRVERAQAQLKAIEQQLAQHESSLKALLATAPEPAEDLDYATTWLAQVQRVVDRVIHLDEVRVRCLRSHVAAKEALEAIMAQLGQAQARAREAQDRLQAAEAQVKHLDDRWRQAERQHAAAALAAGLKPGVPCPVCGSYEHPAPAHKTGDRAEGEATHTTDPVAAQRALELATAQLSQARLQYEESQAHVARWEAEAAAKTDRLRSARSDLAEAEAQLQAARSELPAVWQAEPVETLPGLWQAEMASHRARQARLVEWQRRCEAAQEQHHKLREALNRAQQVAAIAQADYAHAVEADQEAQRECEAATAALEAAQAALDRARGVVSTEEIPKAVAAIEHRDREVAKGEQALRVMDRDLAELDSRRTTHQVTWQQLTEWVRDCEVAWRTTSQDLARKQEQLVDLTGGEAPGPQLEAVQARLGQLANGERDAAAALEQARQHRVACEVAASAAQREHELAAGRRQRALSELTAALQVAGFVDATTATAALRTPARQAELAEQIRQYEEAGAALAHKAERVRQALAGRHLTPEAWAERQANLARAQQAHAKALQDLGASEQRLADIKQRHQRWQELEAQRKELVAERDLLLQLQGLLRGNAFVEFVAEEQLRRVAAGASERLGQLTRYRYALEVDSGGGFVMRDDWNGGVRRPVSTLSGGETFLTALSLALALSMQIQLRGEDPLEFFFLDEGFGTLDPELLDVVIGALERLQLEQLAVGLISHVPELKARIQRRIVVEPAQVDGSGSQLRIEGA